MSTVSTTQLTPPRLILSVLLLALALVAALVFANAFEEAPALSKDPTVCGDPIPEGLVEHAEHAEHPKPAKPDKPLYYMGGLYSPSLGLSGQLDSAILAAAKGRPIICVSASAVDADTLVVIHHSPLQLNRPQDVKPDLFLAIDYAGSTSSIEYPGASALQQYITQQKDNFNNILIIEPLPGPKPDPDEDWTYLNFDSDDNIQFFTPKRKATPEQVLATILKELRGEAMPTGSDIDALLAQLDADDTAKANDARWLLSQQNPYKLIAKLDAWVDAASETCRAQRVSDALTIRRAMGVHADELIAEASASEDSTLRALAARAIGDLATVTHAPIAALTPLAEDDVRAVRYEALVATRSMPGRRAAGVAELVEPYEMDKAMRAVYQGTMAELLTYGEPVAADSKANRLRRMPIRELLKKDRNTLACTILLERTDLPDNKIDEVLGQLAKANGQGPLTALINTLQTMNPRTLAKRDALLKKLVSWNPNELNAQTPRLKEMALGNRPMSVRSAAAAAIIMSNDTKGVFAELGPSPMPYLGLAWIEDTAALKRWADPVSLRILTQKDIPQETTIAAIDAARLLPNESITKAMVDGLFEIARGPKSLDLRFAAIRAINALPASIKPEADDLTLATLTIGTLTGMKYDKTSLTVTAGRPVELTMVNTDTMEHNLVITLPGRAQEIGIAMSADPTAAAAIGYVPKDSDAVLHYTRMLKPGESQTLRFIAPSKPGNYEYVCTYPGHSAVMNGILQVVAP